MRGAGWVAAGENFRQDPLGRPWRVADEPDSSLVALGVRQLGRRGVDALGHAYPTSLRLGMVLFMN